MDFLVRLVQLHESFRIPELQSAASITGVNLEIIEYSSDVSHLPRSPLSLLTNPQSPYCIIRLQSLSSAKQLIQHTILSHGIYELWGSGADYATLHESIKPHTSHLWPTYHTSPFRFSVHGFRGKRTAAEQRALIESFAYLDFQGPIVMKPTAAHPEETIEQFAIFELYPPPNNRSSPTTTTKTTLTALSPKPSPPLISPPPNEPTRVFLARHIAPSARHLITSYDLKSRPYISTTSMDATLSLLTATLALARPGALFYDPVSGTGGLPLGCAAWGAAGWGSDIDGRAVRGLMDGRCKAGPGRKSAERGGVEANFGAHGLLGRWLGGFVADLTNSPVRTGRGGRERWADGVVCDPPYGVREGCKVLGERERGVGWVVKEGSVGEGGMRMVGGEPAYL